MLSRFRDLVEAHQHRVFTFACYYLGNREDAEDVTQEVLLRLWHNVDSVAPETAGAWLARVTRNACFDALRSRRSRKRVFREGLEDAKEEPVTTTPDPEQAAGGWDVRRHLERALKELDEPYRTIIILREIQGHKYQEISEVLDLPLNTVKTYLHRGRRRLRELLREVTCYA